jgi:hypothetical protein
VQWPVVDANGAECVNSLPETVSFAVPQVTNLAARLAVTPALASAEWWERRNLVLTGGAIVDSLKGVTLSGRRVPFWDVASPTQPGLNPFVNCSDQRVAGRVEPVGDDPEPLADNEPLVIRAYQLKCSAADGQPVPVKLRTTTCHLVPPGEPCEVNKVLEDNGGGADEIPGDGLYSLSWPVPTPGWRDFTVTLWPTGVADTFDMHAGP